MKRLVLLGGGHCHSLVASIIGLQQPNNLQVVLISSEKTTPYSGMLPGYLAGHYKKQECFIDLNKLCYDNNVEFIQQEIVGLAPDSRTLHFKNGQSYSYDLLSINTGSMPSEQMMTTQSIKPIKPIDDFIDWLDDWMNPPPKNHSVGVIGGGASGIEIAMSLQHRINSCRHNYSVSETFPKIFLLEGSSTILPGYPKNVQTRIMSILNAWDIEVFLDKKIVSIECSYMVTQSGERIEMNRGILSIFDKAPSFLTTLGLQTNNGFVTVNRFLQSVSFPEIFVSGDSAYHPYFNKPLPRAGVFAVRQSKTLAFNLLAYASKKPLRSWETSLQYLSIISLGNKYALARRGDWVVEGSWVWKWKNILDRRFMRQFPTKENGS